MRLPSHTTVVAYLALFAAVSTGGAFAVSIDRNQIKSRHLADDAVQQENIADDAVGVDQLDEVPNGRMEGGAANIISDPFTDAPITYNKLRFGTPADAFNLAKGTFTAPAAGSYLVTTQIVWVDHTGTGRDARLIKLKADGSPGTTLIGPSSVIDNGGNQILNQTVRLKEGDVIQLTVANQANNGHLTSSGMAVNFLAG